MGSSGSALAVQGLNNAFANVANLAAISTGSAAASATNITRPVANIDTIANILSACVDGLTANSNCGTLFKYTESAGATGTVPTDTATAAINLAHNPYPTSAGMTALWGLAPGAGSPFAPGLTTQPNDFTLALTLKGNGLSGDVFLAIDAAGNAWVTNSYSLSEFTSTGSAASGSPFTGGGLSQYEGGIAIDTSGNLWVPNSLANNISVFSSAGIPKANTPYSGGGLNEPQCVAIDASGNAWFANALGNSISAFSSTGTPLSASGFAGSNYAECLGISPANQIWVTNAYNTLSVFTNAGSAVAGSPFSGGGLNGPFGIAFDLSGNAWSANIYGNNLSVFTNAGTPVTGSPFGGAGMSYPEFLAIDSAGNVWVADYTTNRISELSSSGAAITPASGYTGGITGNTIYPAIDGSGNVWVTQKNATVTELIGAAAPVVTPIVANLLPPYGTSAVNRP
jgi:sugar lactone lactonase YvrE